MTVNQDIRHAKSGLIVLSYLHLCFRDKDGYHWLTGRVDDVINVRYLFDFIIFSSFNPPTQIYIA